MAEPAKYLFDRSFGQPAAGRRESAAERKLRAEHELRVETARGESFEAGRAEGEARVRATREADVARALASLSEAAGRLQGGMTEECDAIHRHAVQVAVAVAERLSREFIRREPLSEIEALFAECLRHIAQAPHIAVRVNPDLAEAVEQRLAAITGERSYGGQLSVRGDDAVAVGDCRMEWAEGGIARDLETTLAGIQEAIGRHLAARARLPNDHRAAPSDSRSAGDQPVPTDAIKETKP